MSKKCELTGKSPLKGHKVSHANNKAKRKFLPNLKKVTFKIDILKTEWSPMLTLRKALLSLQLLLQCPNPDDPQDHIVADQYLNSTHNWEATAKLWTKERALNVNYLETMPPLFEKSVYIEYQKKALEKYYSVIDQKTMMMIHQTHCI